MHQDTHYWYPPETIVLSVVPFIIVKEKQCAAFRHSLCNMLIQSC